MRLTLAPVSALVCFRALVSAECPVTRPAAPHQAPVPRRTRPDPAPRQDGRFLDLVTERHGPLAPLPLKYVPGCSRYCRRVTQLTMRPSCGR